jgi:DNA-binding transcriptional ArsR family regulator
VIPDSILSNFAESSTAKPHPTDKYARRMAAREAILSNKDLSTGARCLYLMLDEYARASDKAFPSQETLSGRLGIPVRTIQYHLRELRNRGFVEARRRYPGGPNDYILTARETEAPPAIPPATHCGTHPQSIAAPPATHCGSRARVLNTSLNTEIEDKKSNTAKHAFSPDQSMLSQESFDELADAFDRHLKHHRTEPRDTVLQMLMDQAQQGKFDWAKLRDRHAGYAAYWDRHGWNFCPLSFLGWIRAGMPPAPREIAPGSNAPRESATERAIRVGYERIAKDGHL